MDVKEAIEKCNLYIQAGATINVVDKTDGKIAFVTYDTTAIETVLSELEKKDDQIEYVKNEYGRTIEEKDLIINEMADIISSIMTGVTAIQNQFEEEYCEFIKSDEDCCWKTDKECSDCIKEYFTKKCEGK